MTRAPSPPSASRRRCGPARAALRLAGPRGPAIAIVGLGHVGRRLRDASPTAVPNDRLRPRSREAGRRRSLGRLGPPARRPCSPSATSWRPARSAARSTRARPSCAARSSAAAATISSPTTRWPTTRRAGDPLRARLHRERGRAIHVYREIHGLGRERLDQFVNGIGDAIGRIFKAAEARSVTPLEAARSVALEQLHASAPGAEGGSGGRSLGWSSPKVDRAQLIDWIGRYQRAWRSPGTGSSWPNCSLRTPANSNIRSLREPAPRPGGDPGDVGGAGAAEPTRISR